MHDMHRGGIFEGYIFTNVKSLAKFTKMKFHKCKIKHSVSVSMYNIAWGKVCSVHIQYIPCVFLNPIIITPTVSPTLPLQLLLWDAD